MDMETIKKKVLEDVDPKIRRQKLKEKRLHHLVFAVEMAAAALVVVVVFYFLLGMSTVQGKSMYPTLQDQDVVLYKRNNVEYCVGDVVAIERPDGEKYVKRIAAVAGDTVNIQNGKVYVNGMEYVNDSALGETLTRSADVTYPLVVGDEEVFVLGDNREISKDSREIGTVKLEAVQGKIVWCMGKL